MTIFPTSLRVALPLMAFLTTCASRLVIPIEATSVVQVTSLAADGPGSLRRALAVDGPRVVVFEVGGVIDLQGRTLYVRKPHVTIAGQTAPDPGITLIRGGLIVETHHVVVQHIAVRPGDHKKERGWTPDALGVRRGEHGPVHDVLFEHCSATWAVDENLSTSGPADVEGPDVTAHDITMRYCLIAEGLSNSTHPKGEHSKGTLIHDGVRNVVIEGCLYAHNEERNPRLKGGVTAVIRDSVMYNWGSGCIGVGARGNDRVLTPAEAVITGNVAIPGPDTRSKVFVKGLDPGARVTLRDNLTPGLRVADERVIVTDLSGAPPPQRRKAGEGAGSPLSAAERALRSAGSRPARRDPIDRRIVNSVIRGDGRIIDSQDEVGGYPVRAETRRTLTVPAGDDARRTWLKKLSDELSEDKSLDVTPLRARVNAAPSPDSRK